LHISILLLYSTSNMVYPMISGDAASATNAVPVVISSSAPRSAEVCDARVRHWCCVDRVAVSLYAGEDNAAVCLDHN